MSIPYLEQHQGVHLWKLALQAGYGQVWDPAWNVRLWQCYHSNSDTCLLRSSVTPAWKSSGCKFGFTGILDVLPSPYAGCSLLPMSRQVSWAQTLLGYERSFLQNYWDFPSWRMLCQAFGTRCTANLNLEKIRRKNAWLWRWDSGTLTSLLSINRERPQKGSSPLVRSGLVPEGLSWVHEMQWDECKSMYPARAKAKATRLA